MRQKEPVAVALKKSALIARHSVKIAHAKLCAVAGKHFDLRCILDALRHNAALQISAKANHIAQDIDTLLIILRLGEQLGIEL